jgi:enamine deaminase RidA (YjgF/YER057c/UK114 family)
MRKKARNKSISCIASSGNAGFYGGPFMPARKGKTMKNIRTLALTGAIAALLCGTASAAEIERLYGPNAMSPIASAVSVPPGYTTFYVSGALPNAVTPAADGKPADFGDITAQTRSVLDNLKAVMEKQGIGFGDVVAAHVFLDPKADFMAMNKVWATEFGTAAQPNKPARAAMRVDALVLPGALLEIEFIAAKKMPMAKKK